jgi:DNA-binding CsgD family transcriptional regulator
MDFLLSRGAITVIAALEDDKRPRAQIETLVAKSVTEAAPFFSLWEATLSVQSISTYLREVTNLSTVGTIVVDIHANVLFANDAAERICDQSEALRLTNGTLRAAALHDSLRLHAAIEHVVSQSERETTNVPVIALTRMRKRPMMITLNPLSGQLGRHPHRGAILCIFDPDCETSASVHPACEFYRLSAMESKLAQLMTQGHSIMEAAERLHLKEHTARSYLKQIFQKTGTKRQGELVAILLRTSVHCGPKQRVSLVD